VRTFIAVKIPVEQKLTDFLRSIKSELRNDNIKWVDFTTLHITLFFLGETNAAQAQGIERVFKENFSNVNQFELTLKGFGYFGARQNPKVLWIGINPSQQLIDLHGETNKNIADLGFTPDSRGFNPHITIGRVKHTVVGKSISDFANEYENVIFQKSLIDRVILYKSELKPSGPIYTPIASQLFR
jgi:RNA 2',3'-cyclic 3'-phosphodiesterase